MVKINAPYGRLTVIKDAGRTSYGRRQFECLCSCGNTIIAESSNIERGHTSSCGCLRDELQFKHGMSQSKEFMIWASMRARCNNKNSQNYKFYGARGIKVCGRWDKSFKAFYEDMGSKPDGHSINRVNNDGNYEPSNCEWSTAKNQMNNMQGNHNITFKGITKTLTEWSEKFGLKSPTVRRRLKKGWSVANALTMPLRPGRALKNA